MRRLATISITAALFIGGAGAAMADSWNEFPETQTGGASFRSGQYKWEAPGKHHGAFHLKGRLADTNTKDGHNVYVEIRVAGYDWNRFKGVQNGVARVDALVYDGAARYTNDASVRVCRDRGTIRIDDCSTTRTFKRAHP